MEHRWRSGNVLTSHLCNLGSISVLGISCALSLLLVLSLLHSRFFGFSRKTNTSKFKVDLDVECLNTSPWLGWLGDYCSLHFSMWYNIVDSGNNIDNNTLTTPAVPTEDVCSEPGSCPTVARPIVDANAIVNVIFGLKGIDRSGITREHVIEKKVGKSISLKIGSSQNFILLGIKVETWTWTLVCSTGSWKPWKTVNSVMKTFEWTENKLIECYLSKTCKFTH